jgi:hypothetical protein
MKYYKYIFNAFTSNLVLNYAHSCLKIVVEPETCSVVAYNK